MDSASGPRVSPRPRAPPVGPLQQPAITDRTHAAPSHTSIRLVATHMHTLPSLHSRRSFLDVPARLLSRRRQAPLSPAASVPLLISHSSGCIRSAPGRMCTDALSQHMAVGAACATTMRQRRVGSVSGRLLGDVCFGSRGKRRGRQWCRGGASCTRLSLDMQIVCYTGLRVIRTAPALFFSCTSHPPSADCLHTSLTQNE